MCVCVCACVYVQVCVCVHLCVYMCLPHTLNTGLFSKAHLKRNINFDHSKFSFCIPMTFSSLIFPGRGSNSALKRNTMMRRHLQHTTTHCNTLQTLQHTATRCLTLQTLRNTATHCRVEIPRNGKMISTNTATQPTATHCNTLQHTATHRNTYI